MTRNIKIVIDALILSIILIAIDIVVPFFIGLIKSGFLLSEVISTFTWNSILMICIVGILAAIGLEYIFTKNDEKYGDGNGFSSLGEKPAFKFFKRFTVPQLTLIFLIFFLILGLLSLSSAGKQIAYTGVGSLESQQFTPLDNIIYSTSNVPISENIIGAFVILLFLISLRAVARKYNWDSILFIMLAIVGGTILLGVSGGSWHLMRYSNSEVALMTTIGFWLLGGFFTMITGLFTPFWMQHLVNNLLYDLAGIMSLELVRLYTIIGIIVLVLIYIFIYRKRLFGDKNRIINKFVENSSYY